MILKWLQILFFIKNNLREKDETYQKVIMYITVIAIITVVSGKSLFWPKIKEF